VEITGLPGETTPLPLPTAEPATPLPALPSGISPSELKYKVLEQFPNDRLQPVQKEFFADLEKATGKPVHLIKFKPVG